MIATILAPLFHLFPFRLIISGDVKIGKFSRRSATAVHRPISHKFESESRFDQFVRVKNPMPCTSYMTENVDV